MVTVVATGGLQTIRPQNSRNSNKARLLCWNRLLWGVALLLTVDLVYKQVVSSWRDNNNTAAAQSGLKAQEQTVAAAAAQDAAATTKEDAPDAENVDANDADVQKKEEKPYVKFTMYMDRESKVLYGEHHCPLQDKGANDDSAGTARAPLDAALQERLGFATQIETNLNVIIYGDSLGMQMAHALQEATGVLQLEELQKTADNQQQALSISHTSRNAFVAAWRTTGLLSRWNENKAGPDAAGGGWNRAWAQRLRDSMASKSPSLQSSTFHMDVFVMRIPATTWIQPYMIRKQGLLESVALAHEVFGAKHVILLTSPFTNHIQDQEMWGKLRNLNIMIRKLAASYEPHSIKGVERISVLDTAAWVEQLMQFNANLLGYTHTTLVSGSGPYGGIDPDYPFGRLSCGGDGDTATQPGLLIAQSCAIQVQPGECECVQNRLFVDGTHWCMETMGGRWAAGLACVMGCHYKHQDGSDEVVRACEQTCNDRFMSLTPAQELVSEIP